MHKIINGARYNTETARKVGEWDNKQYGNFGFVSETLYCTKSGKYFIHGEGGASSEYGEMYGNNLWGDGEKIVPLGRQDALNWASEKLDGDEVEKEFEIPDEDDTLQIGVNITHKTKNILNAAKKRTDKTYSELVSLAIVEMYGDLAEEQN